MQVRVEVGTAVVARKYEYSAVKGVDTARAARQGTRNCPVSGCGLTNPVADSISACVISHGAAYCWCTESPLLSPKERMVSHAMFVVSCVCTGGTASLSTSHLMA